MSVTEIFHYLTHSEDIIKHGGLLLLVLIVYAENGLFFGFFLPGDYLLFSAGLFAGTGDFPVALPVLLAAVTTAATLGSYTGYLFGRQVGKSLLSRPDSFFFKRRYIVKTRAVYIKYSGNTLLVGRFLPIVRTFAPILAGMVNMNLRKFWYYNLLGGCIWVFSLIAGGYFLGQTYPEIVGYLEYIIIGFVGLTSIVVLRGFLMNKKKPKV